MQKTYYFYTLSSTRDLTNVRYVGVTTRSLKQRLYGHKYYAMHPEIRATPVHKWMAHEYKEHFDIIITEIDKCLAPEWEEKEIYWISKYRSDGFNLLNIQKGGSGVVTKEMRDISGVQRSINARKKAVYALNDKLEIVYAFDSAIEACRFFGGVSKTAITNAISKNIKTKKSFGYYWVRQEDYKNGTYYVNTSVYHSKNQVKVYKYDKYGKCICSFDSLSAAIQNEGVKGDNGVRQAIKKKSLYRDCFWSTKENDCFDLDSFYRFFEIENNGKIINKYIRLTDILNKYNLSLAHFYKKDKTYNWVLPNGNKIIKNKNYK